MRRDFNWKEIGGAERDRTAGLLVANEALSQLSYSPTTYLVYQRVGNQESARNFGIFRSSAHRDIEQNKGGEPIRFPAPGASVLENST